RSLVDKVFEIGAGKAGRGTGELVDIHIVGKRNLARVDFEDAFASPHVGARNHDASIEPARAQQGRIENIGAIGRRDQDYALVGLESVHLDEQLVEGLLAFIVSAAEAGAAMASHRIDFIYEDNTGRVLLALHEKIAHPRSADANEHLD